MTRLLTALLVSGATVATPLLQAPVPNQVHVALTDAKGNPLSNATARTFEVRIDEIEAPVLSAMPATQPLALVLVVEGMEAPWTQNIRKAMRAMLESVRKQNPASRIGLMLAPGPAPPMMHNVVAGTAELDKEISRFVGGAQDAPLLESILVACQSLETEKSTRRIVIALAAGANSNHGVSAPSRVLAGLRQSGVSLWALDLGWGARTVSPAEERVLQEAVHLSGGRHVFSNPTAVTDAAKRVLEVIHSQYLVTYRRPDQASDRPSLRIGVRSDTAVVVAPSWVAGR